MTASNLPYEPEFEQAYKGMSLFFFFFFSLVVQIFSDCRSTPRCPSIRVNLFSIGPLGKWFSGSVRLIILYRARFHPGELHSLPEEARVPQGPAGRLRPRARCSVPCCLGG